MPVCLEDGKENIWNLGEHSDSGRGTAAATASWSFMSALFVKGQTISLQIDVFAPKKCHWSVDIMPPLSHSTTAKRDYSRGRQDMVNDDDFAG